MLHHESCRQQVSPSTAALMDQQRAVRTWRVLGHIGGADDEGDVRQVATKRVLEVAHHPHPAQQPAPNEAWRWCAFGLVLTDGSRGRGSRSSRFGDAPLNPPPLGAEARCKLVHSGAERMTPVSNCSPGVRAAMARAYARLAGTLPLRPFKVSCLLAYAQVFWGPTFLIPRSRSRE